jgi:hypothetical protein
MGTRQKTMLDQLEMLTRISGAQGVTWTPGGPSIVQPGLQFRFGLTSSRGIPAANPIQPKDGTNPEVPGIPGIASDVTSVTITLDDPKNGKMKSWPDDQFTGANPFVGSIPASTLLAFALINDLWVPLAGGSASHFGIITTTITARSGTQSGNGVVSVRVKDKAGGIITPKPAIDPITVYNWAATSFTVNHYCWISQDAAGTWWLVSCECP